MEIPQVFLESGVEDLQDSEDNIIDLSSEFLAPIDRLRSFSRFNGNETSDVKLQNIVLSNTFALESRLHAFYRMLGLPVITTNGEFYNPGFNPEISKSALEQHQNINNKLKNSNLGTFLLERENLFINLRNIFQTQNFSASLYTLALKHPRPYALFKPDSDPLALEEQTFSLDIRNEEIQSLKQKNQNLVAQISDSSQQLSRTVVGVNFNGGRHPLKPWCVDNKIEETVTPDTSKICAPFLPTRNSTKISSNSYLLRPGLELIIRLRLQNLTEDTQFLTDVEKIINGDSQPNLTSEVDLATLKSSISILAEDNKIQGSVLDLFEGFTNLQTIYVTKLTKLIKNCLKQQILAIQTINSIASKINWLPIPSIAGPETGTTGSSLLRAGTNDSWSEIDNRITELRIKQLNAQRNLVELNNLGNFASPFQNNIAGEKFATYQQELDQLINSRDHLAQQGLQAMGIIELISGEISGLGLVDTLAIYLTLWSLDLPTLLGLLDIESQQRLISFNPEFNQASNSFGTSILTSLTTFQNLLFNILSFCDKFLLQQLLNPTENGEF